MQHDREHCERSERADRQQGEMHSGESCVHVRACELVMRLLAARGRNFLTERIAARQEGVVTFNRHEPDEDEQRERGLVFPSSR